MAALDPYPGSAHRPHRALQPVRGPLDHRALPLARVRPVLLGWQPRRTPASGEGPGLAGKLELPQCVVGAALGDVDARLAWPADRGGTVDRRLPTYPLPPTPGAVVGLADQIAETIDREHIEPAGGAGAHSLAGVQIATERFPWRELATVPRPMPKGVVGAPCKDVEPVGAPCNRGWVGG